MSIFESVKKTLTKTAKGAAKASGELVEQTKLKLKVIDIKDEINTRYTKIGELYYNVAEYELDCGDSISDLVDEIRALKEELAEVEEEIKKNKSLNKCSTCGAENDAEDVYCRKCGSKLN